MHSSNDSSPQIPGVVWESQDMRRALAGRDLKAVFELLQRRGISQRRIARSTGQSPSEIFEVLYKGRRIAAYDVLVRIADGLGIPRGYLGLAYDRTTEVALDLADATCSTDADERTEVRELLSHAANVTMGTSVGDLARWWQPVDRATAPAPHRIGSADVEYVHAITAAMRAVDYRHGGGACRDAVAAQVRWAQQLLTAECADDVRRKFLIALADLHNLAGWTSHDVGMHSTARRHFGRALELAGHAGDRSLAANILYRMGRLHLHRGMPLDALRFFQLGQITAQDTGCSITEAMLCANEGWAYGMLNDREQVRRSLGRAEDEFSRAEPQAARAWVSFFGRADLHASIGIALSASPSAGPMDLDEAIDNFGRSIALRGPDMMRSRTFEQIAIATSHLRLGNRELGLRIGRQALDAAANVRSIRTVDRLTPLRDAACRHTTDRELQDMCRGIEELQASV